MQKVTAFARKNDGTLMSAGTGTWAVYLPGTTTPVTIYSSDSTGAGAPSATIPVTGKIEFYARNADLKIVATEGAQTVTIDDFTVTAGITFGTLAARPAAGSTDRFYMATDVGRMYYDNGSAWKDIIDYSLDAMDWAAAADIVISAGTNDVFGGGGNFVELTNSSGSPAITALASGNATEGSPRLIKFTITGGTPTVTHNATSLEISGSANWTPATGDMAWVIGKGGSNVRLIPLLASGSLVPGAITALAATIAQSYAGSATTVFVTPASLPGNVITRSVTTSGTSVDFTGIPANVKRININFEGVSTSGGNSVIVQLGTSGGVQTTGYLGGAGGANGAGTSGSTTHTDGIAVEHSGNSSAASVRHGSITLTLSDSANGGWCAQGVIGFSAGGGASYTGAQKTLSGTLDRIRITSVGGTDTFDAGAVSIAY